MQSVLRRLADMDRHLRNRAASSQIPTPGAPDSFAKYPGRDFDYLQELDALEDLLEPAPDRVIDEVSDFFRAAQRPESPLCRFNLNVLPTVDATAAACLSVTANVNALMDAFGGESLLVEQKVARTIGRWAGWPEAMGISCGGGKSTMIYALRCALARAVPDSARRGVSARAAVICSAGAHYSVEHVAAIIGMGAEQVIRVPMDRSGATRPEALRAAMEDAHRTGSAIAAIVCCGGTVIDFCCDELARTRAIAEDFAREHHVPLPYLHFDSVIGWPFLALRGMPTSLMDELLPPGPGRHRVEEVLRRCEALPQFDSLGVDLHKSGLCPYASSFFVARDRAFMNALGDGTYVYGPEDFRFGRLRAYRYTLENTRPTHGTLAAWVNLVGLGRKGIGAYLSDLHEGRAGVEAALRRHGRFEPLNPQGLGWDVVFDIPQPPELAPLPYGEFAIGFMEHCWRRVREGHGLPLFSIVPEWHVDHQPELSRIAFVLYPMGRHEPRAWDWMVKSISDELDRFVAQGSAGSVGPWERPIR
jgi:glutamate/tyrosine decarboxylase-like PLP-dependent enzyme